ncbi:unnamed protein product [Brassica oleracea]
MGACLANLKCYFKATCFHISKNIEDICKWCWILKMEDVSKSPYFINLFCWFFHWIANSIHNL